MFKISLKNMKTDFTKIILLFIIVDIASAYGNSQMVDLPMLARTTAGTCNCKNGGLCENKICYCSSPWTGDTCNVEVSMLTMIEKKYLI